MRCQQGLNPLFQISFTVDESLITIRKCLLCSVRWGMSGNNSKTSSSGYSVDDGITRVPFIQIFDFRMMKTSTEAKKLKKWHHDKNIGTHRFFPWRHLGCAVDLRSRSIRYGICGIVCKLDDSYVTLLCFTCAKQIEITITSSHSRQ